MDRLADAPKDATHFDKERKILYRVLPNGYYDKWSWAGKWVASALQRSEFEARIADNLIIPASSRVQKPTRGYDVGDMVGWNREGLTMRRVEVVAFHGNKVVFYDERTNRYGADSPERILPGRAADEEIKRRTEIHSLVKVLQTIGTLQSTSLKHLAEDLHKRGVRVGGDDT